MKPVEFPEQNLVLKAPPGMEEEVKDLPVFKNQNTIISCWQLTEDEKQEVQEKGKIWVGVLSPGTQPPILLMAENPFEELRNRIEKKQNQEGGWLP